MGPEGPDEAETEAARRINAHARAQMRKQARKQARAHTTTMHTHTRTNTRTNTLHTNTQTNKHTYRHRARRRPQRRDESPKRSLLRGGRERGRAKVYLEDPSRARWRRRVLQRCNCQFKLCQEPVGARCSLGRLRRLARAQPTDTFPTPPRASPRAAPLAAVRVVCGDVAGS